MSFQLNLEQLRKQAKERVRERRAAGQDVKLVDVQFELARELGFHSWPKLKAYIERLALEQPFRTDLDYYEGRADGIASVKASAIARGATRPRHSGTASRAGRGCAAMSRRCAAARSRRRRSCSPIERSRRTIVTDSSAARPVPGSRSSSAGPTAMTCSGWPATWRSSSLLLESRRRPQSRQRLRLDEAPPGRVRQRPRARGADARRRRAHRRIPLAATAAHRSFRRSSGATAKSQSCSAGSPGNLRVAAGLGDLDLIRELVGTPAGWRASRLLPPPRRLPRLAALRRARRRCSTKRSSGRRSPTASKRSASLSS